jgi:hypothetical protein
VGSTYDCHLATITNASGFSLKATDECIGKMRGIEITKSKNSQTACFIHETALSEHQSAKDEMRNAKGEKRKSEHELPNQIRNRRRQALNN